MPDINDIIEKVLRDHRIRESATFSSRTFSDQPILERGSDFKKRVTEGLKNRAAREAQREQERERRIAQREAARAARKRQQEFVRQQERNTLPLDFELWGTPSSSPASDQPARTSERLPDRIREMRRLERGGVPSRLTYSSSASASLFYQQAKLMEDYEDSFEFHGGFVQYYPTYAAMSDRQLRGYFSWRTQVRKGNVNAAPLSFAYVYLYELLCGIGTTPGKQGLQDLREFGRAWREVNEGAPDSLQGYLTRWIHDYAIYHDLTDELPSGFGYETAQQALVLLRAEHAQLRQAGGEPRIPNESATGAAPSQEEVYQALSKAATYHLCDSRLAKAEPELTASVACDVFAALVTHCARRRKTDFVEGLFGYAYVSPYTMYSAAVFFEETPHPDATVLVDNFEEFTCKDGRWRRNLPIESNTRNKDLGRVLHQVDFELRQQLDYAYPLKEKKVPKYVEKIVRDAVAARLAERAEAERRRITIDRSKLRGIRAAAAVTQEALLTDEERTEEPTSLFVQDVVEPNPVAAVRMPEPPTSASETTQSEREANGEPSAEGAPTTPEPSDADSPLTPLEARFVRGLMDGQPASCLLGPGDPFVSVVADSINEKLFDLVGDAVIEFDGDEPCLIEDYLDDIREVL